MNKDASIAKKRADRHSKRRAAALKRWKHEHAGWKSQRAADLMARRGAMVRGGRW